MQKVTAIKLNMALMLGLIWCLSLHAQNNDALSAMEMTKQIQLLPHGGGKIYYGCKYNESTYPLMAFFKKVIDLNKTNNQEELTAFLEHNRIWGDLKKYFVPNEMTYMLSQFGCCEWPDSVRIPEPDKLKGMPRIKWASVSYPVFTLDHTAAIVFLRNARTSESILFINRDGAWKPVLFFNGIMF